MRVSVPVCARLALPAWFAVLAWTALLLCFSSPTPAQNTSDALHPPPLTTISAAFNVSRSQAARALPIRLDATVTYSDPEWHQMFIQDKTGFTFLALGDDKTQYPLGAHVRVLAQTGLNENGITLVHPRVQVLGEGSLPAPLIQALAEVDAGGSESHFVQTTGVVHPCTDTLPRICFRIYDGDTRAWITVRHADAKTAAQMVGSTVRVRGVVGRYQENGKKLGMELMLESLHEMEMLDPPATLAAPEPIASVTVSAAEARFAHQRRVHGTVLWTAPGLMAVRDATGTIFSTNFNNIPVHTGQRVDVVGFPTMGEFGIQFADAFVSVDPAPAPITELQPVRVSLEEALGGALGGKRIQLRARLLNQREAARASVYELSDGNSTFTARILHAASEPPPMQLPLGAQLDLTGLPVPQSDPKTHAPTLTLLVESPSDIRLHTAFGWLTARKAAIILTIMLLSVGVPLLWVRQLRSTVHKQTTALRAQWEKEHQLEDRFRRLFERNLAAVFTWKPNGTILECNTAFVKLLGFDTREQLLGRSYWDFEVDLAQQERLMRLTDEAVLSNREAILQRRDGTKLHMMTNLTAVNTAEGLVYETTAIDVTQLRMHQDELKRARDLAVHESLKDPLTGLPNRRCILDELAHQLALARRDGTRLAVLYLDLDGFKFINDSLGHTLGDELLIQAAGRMRDWIHDGDMLARIGGDEFLIVMNQLDSIEAPGDLARQLIDSIAEPFSVRDHRPLIGASIGISLFPADASDAKEMMQHADTAMYAAKRAGKNSVVYFNAEIGSGEQERLTLDHLLRGAVAREEISVHFQPEFDLATSRLIRFEALARWTHPTLGAIPPAKFIPIAEENGMIAILGACVMEMACREAHRWQDKSPQPIQVAVNVSSIQFRNRYFVQEVQSILARTELPPELLQIEVTESVMMEGGPESAATLRQLREMGICIAIDDFGTGYSNLSYLPTMAFDVLKIDRSFVKHLEAQPEAANLIRTLVSMAANMSMKVIVEGVETAGQLAIIRSCGAHEVQGYLMGRPTPNPVEDFLHAMEDDFVWT